MGVEWRGELEDRNWKIENGEEAEEANAEAQRARRFRKENKSVKCRIERARRGD